MSIQVGLETQEPFTSKSWHTPMLHDGDNVGDFLNGQSTSLVKPVASPTDLPHGPTLVDEC